MVDVMSFAETQKYVKTHVKRAWHKRDLRNWRGFRALRAVIPRGMFLISFSHFGKRSRNNIPFSPFGWQRCTYCIYLQQGTPMYFNNHIYECGGGIYSPLENLHFHCKTWILISCEVASLSSEKHSFYFHWIFCSINTSTIFTEVNLASEKEVSDFRVSTRNLWSKTRDQFIAPDFQSANTPHFIIVKDSFCDFTENGTTPFCKIG